MECDGSKLVETEDVVSSIKYMNVNYIRDKELRDPKVVSINFSQTTEWKPAKLPNENQPNYRIIC